MTVFGGGNHCATSRTKWFFLSFVALKILHLKYKFWPVQRVAHKFLEKARNVPIRFLDPRGSSLKERGNFTKKYKICRVKEKIEFRYYTQFRWRWRSLGSKNRIGTLRAFSKNLCATRCPGQNLYFTCRILRATNDKKNQSGQDVAQWFPPPKTVIFLLLSDQVLDIFQKNSKRIS